MRQTIAIEAELSGVLQEEKRNQEKDLAEDRKELRVFKKNSNAAERRRNNLFKGRLHPLLQDDDNDDKYLQADDDEVSDGEEPVVNKQRETRRVMFLRSLEELDIPKADPTQFFDETRFQGDPPMLDNEALDADLERLKAAISRKLDQIFENQQGRQFLDIHGKICLAKEKLMQMMETIDPARAQRIIFDTSS